jgi:hypothetical protein
MRANGYVRQPRATPSTTSRHLDRHVAPSAHSYQSLPLKRPRPRVHGPVRQHAIDGDGLTVVDVFTFNELHVAHGC